MTEPTELSDHARELQQRIVRLTRELEDQTDPEGRAAVIEQIEILRAEFTDEAPHAGDPLDL